MRRKIFDIYKALRHFNVTAGEVRDIAEGYRYWINNPFESRPPYNTVYFLEDKLYSMPYPRKSLESFFIGIEIDGVVYLSIWRNYVYADKVATTMEQLKSAFWKEKSHCAEDSIDLNFPTVKEITAIVDKIRVEPKGWVTEPHFVVCHYFNKYWIKPSVEAPDKTIAHIVLRIEDKVGYDLCSPESNTRAVACLVTHLREGIDFIGEVDEYGAPTEETQELYTKLGWSNIKTL